MFVCAAPRLCLRPGTLELTRRKPPYGFCCVCVVGEFRFVASRHPAVLRGHATVDEVRKELLDTFLSEGAGEGRVRGFSAQRAHI